MLIYIWFLSYSQFSSPPPPLSSPLALLSHKNDKSKIIGIVFVFLWSRNCKPLKLERYSKAAKGAISFCQCVCRPNRFFALFWQGPLKLVDRKPTCPQRKWFKGKQKRTFFLGLSPSGGYRGQVLQVCKFSSCKVESGGRLWKKD